MSTARASPAATHETRVLELPDEAATRALGERLARAIERDTVIHLVGDLGAGKTTLARALVQSLVPDARVKSPTYTLVESYDTPRGTVHHLDLYRIADPHELEFLGLPDQLAHAIALIEWPDKGGDATPRADLVIALERTGEGRRARLEARTPIGGRLLSGT